jgi:hypothetical protein
MAKLTPELEKELRRIVTEWSRDFITKRYAYLIKQKVKATGELTQSLRSELLNNAVGDTQSLLIHFAKHGKFVDMKHADGGEDQINGLIDWMNAKGLANDFIASWWSKHQNKQVPTTILRDIAWGIIITRAKRHKRQRWFNKPKERALHGLNTLLLAALAPAAKTDIVNNLQTPTTT